MKKINVQLCILLAMALPLTLTGCASRWVKPGASEAEFYTDKSACDIKASSLYPPRHHQLQHHCYRAGSTTHCHPSAGIDQNSAPRMAHFKSCMRANGWEFTGKNTP